MNPSSDPEVVPLVGTKEKTSDADAEEGKDYDSKSSKIKNTSKLAVLFGRVLIMVEKYFAKIVACQITLIVLLVIIMPVHMRAQHMKRLNNNLNSFSSMLYGRQETLNATASNLTATINSENGNLVDALADMVGLVSKEHHEEELSRAQLEKQKEIDTLQLAIKLHKKELNLIREQLEASKQAQQAVVKAQQAKERHEKEQLAGVAQEKVIEEEAAAETAEKKTKKWEQKTKAKVEEKNAKNEKKWQKGAKGAKGERKKMQEAAKAKEEESAATEGEPKGKPKGYWLQKRAEKAEKRAQKGQH